MKSQAYPAAGSGIHFGSEIEVREGLFEMANEAVPKYGVPMNVFVNSGKLADVNAVQPVK